MVASMCIAGGSRALCGVPDAQVFPKLLEYGCEVR